MLNLDNQKTCILGMLQKTAELGCGPVDDGGVVAQKCLCINHQFSYGLRDCSIQACGSDVSKSVIHWEVGWCSAVGIIIPVTVATVTKFNYTTLTASGVTCDYTTTHTVTESRSLPADTTTTNSSLWNT